MIRIPLTLLLVQLFTVLTVAQLPDSGYLVSPSTRLSHTTISFVPEANSKDYRFPFSYIEVVDARLDSAKLGFHRPRMSKVALLYTTDSSLHHEASRLLNHYFQRNLDPQSGNQLLVCIKKLWVTDFNRYELESDREMNLVMSLHLKAEIYLKSGENYFPARRIDTVISSNRLQKFAVDYFIQHALVMTVEDVQHADFGSITKRRSIERRRIDSFNMANSYPLVQTVTPQKGVYLNFSEFKNNRPGYKEFDIKFEKLLDVMYVKEVDGKFYAKKNVWGFYNGRNFFIRMGNNYFPLFRQQQTWEFFGSNSIRDRQINTGTLLGNTAVPFAFGFLVAGAAENIKVNSKLVRLRPFQLDMETGLFY
jgi:hypothetical protein